MAKNNNKKAIKAILKKIKDAGGKAFVSGQNANVNLQNKSVDIERIAQMAGRVEEAKKVDKQLEKLLDQVRDEMIDGIINLGIKKGIVDKDDKEGIQALRDQQEQSFRYGIFSKGRRKESKMFIMAGYVPAINMGDTTANYILGDIDVLIDYNEILGENHEQEFDMDIISGQIKGIGSQFNLPARFKSTAVEANARKDFEQGIQDIIKNSFLKAIPKENEIAFRNALEKRIKLVKEQPEKRTEVYEGLDTAEAFFREYIKFTAADYFLFAFKQPALANFTVSVPKNRLIEFVNHDLTTFRRKKDKNKITYTFDPPSRNMQTIFRRMLTNKNMSENFHIHSNYGYSLFIYERKNYLKNQGEINRHRSFLVATWNSFIVPHSAFFDRHNAKRYREDYKRLSKKY